MDEIPEWYQELRLYLDQSRETDIVTLRKENVRLKDRLEREKKREERLREQFFTNPPLEGNDENDPFIANERGYLKFGG